MGKKNPGEKKSKNTEDAEFDELLKQLTTKSERDTPQEPVVPKAEAKKNRQDYALDLKRHQEAEKVEALRCAKQQRYIQLLKSNSDNAEAWYNLGATLRAWTHLKRPCSGSDVGVGGTIQVGNQIFTEVECYVKALTLNPRHPKITEAWTNLGNAVGDGETVQVGSQSYTKEQCYEHAATLDPKNNKAWTNLGATLGDAAVAQVGSQIYTKQQCCAKALTLNPKCVKSWYNLGVSLGVGETVQIGSQIYTKQQCCVQTLTMDPKCLMSWYNLGVCLGVRGTAQVGNRSYTKKECYMQALSTGIVNYDVALPWNLLGSYLDVDPKLGWIKMRTLPTYLQGRPEGYIFTKQQCCVEALKLDPKCVEAWTNLGVSLGVGETAQIGSQSHTKHTCYIEAVKSDSWGTVQVGSPSYTKEQCYVYALTLDPKYADAWYNLGLSLHLGETAQVGGQPYSGKQCYVQVLTLDPKYADAWYNLGNCLGLGEWAQIGGQIYTQRQCFIQAQVLEPTLISPPSLLTLD